MTVEEPARTAGRRWWWLAGPAAVAVVAAVAVPLVLRPATPEPIAPVAEDRGYAWTPVAAPPLTPRHGALTAWRDGMFYVIGGWSGSPCPPGGSCNPVAPDLRDGARYDPAAGTWTPIADAPAPVGQQVTELVAGWNLWLADAGGGPVREYSPYDDAWRELPAAPAAGRLATSYFDSFVLTADGAPAGYRHGLGPAEGWTALPPGPLELCRDRQGFPSGDYRLVLVADCGTAAAAELRASIHDPVTGDWTAPVPLAAELSGLAAYSGSRLAWPELLATGSGPAAGIFDLGAAEWRRPSPPGDPGPLGSGGVTPLVLGDPNQHARGGLVVANGRLLDLDTTAWVEVPAPPVAGRLAPVRAAGPAGLLDCFGFTAADRAGTGTWGDGCWLLTAPAPSDPPPAGPPAVDRIAAGWTAVDSTEELDGKPIDVSRQPALAHAGGDFYLLGGAAGDEGAEVALPTRRLDPATGTWTALAAPQGPVPHYTSVIGTAGDVVYVQFGYGDSEQVWTYDTGADAWSWVANQGTGAERHLVTDDGLLRFAADDDRQLVTRPSRLLTGQGWVELPAPPVISYALHEPFRLDGHRVALESGGRVFTLDTATRAWDAGSARQELHGRDRVAADGTAAFVTPLMLEDIVDPDYRERLDVLAYRDGNWTNPAPLRETGGLGLVTGSAGPRWVVVNGNLLDPATGQWLQVPDLPDAAEAESPFQTVVGDTGLLSCGRPWIDGVEHHTCHHLALP